MCGDALSTLLVKSMVFALPPWSCIKGLCIMLRDWGHAGHVCFLAGLRAVA